MSDQWIVSGHEFVLHKTLAAAEKEQARLREKVPDKTFRLYRVKGSLTKSESRRIIAEQKAELDRHRESIRCMSRFLADCAVTMGTPDGDAEALGDAIGEMKLLNADRRAALAFAASVIKSGEGWTDQCEAIIGAGLKDGKVAA